MKKYSQKEIEEFVSCHKRITTPPRKELKSERGSLRNDMDLESMDGNVGFSVFMRINERFPENFSIGLNVIPKDEPGSFCVLRYNGPHGEHVNSGFEEEHPHYGYHIHKANTDLMDAGILPERYAEITEAYASYEEALVVFLKITNIQNADEYFNPRQCSLFDIGGEK